MGPSAPARLDAAVVRIGAVVMLGALMSILDASVVNVALPSIQESFGTRPGEAVPHPYASWTVTAYALALAAVIPVTGWAGDRFGAHRLYVAALVVFTVGSALCAVTGSMASLVAMRVLQGIGGGMLLPLGMTILARAAGPERMGRLAALPRPARPHRPDRGPAARRMAGRDGRLAVDLRGQSPRRPRGLLGRGS